MLEAEELAAYKRHWHERSERERERTRRLASKARAEARRVAKMLVQEFGAQLVYLFGSLGREGQFHERSDIDLAVRGIAPERFFQAWTAAGACITLPIELVDLDEVGPSMQGLILKYGELLYDAHTD